MTHTTLIEAAEQALEKMNQVTTLEQEDEDILFDAITALRAALEASKEVEPVAWRTIYDGSEGTCSYEYNEMRNGEPLYTHPAPAVSNEVEPSKDQLTQILNGLDRCHEAGSKREFLRTWIRDFVQHKTHPAPAVPEVKEGWQLVPKEPTGEMLDAWQRHFGTIEGAYRSMLAAAPEPKP